MANATNTQLSPQFNFVSSPSSRGTMEILWSSLFTIFACTWTVQHLNVPEQRPSNKPGWRGSLRWHTKKFCTSAKWMMITTIAPEVVIGMACYDLLAAKEILRELQSFATEDDVPWTLTHSYYANMGGFVLQSGVKKPVQATTYISLEDVSLNRGSKRSSGAQNRAVTGRISPKDYNHTNQTPLYSTLDRDERERPSYNLHHLTGRQIWQLRNDGILPKLPIISEMELLDRSKSDIFVKSIAIFQISWATVQIIVRTARYLAISQLELAVLAFATCAILIYGIYWSKPKNVGGTTAILQFEGPIPERVLSLIKGLHTHMGSILLRGDDSVKLDHGSPIRNDAAENYHDDSSYWVYPAMMLGATIFWRNTPRGMELHFSDEH